MTCHRLQTWRCLRSPNASCLLFFYLYSLAYNKETDEIIGGGKGFVETWKLSGKEVSRLFYAIYRNVQLIQLVYKNAYWYQYSIFNLPKEIMLLTHLIKFSLLTNFIK